MSKHVLVVVTFINCIFISCWVSTSGFAEEVRQSESHSDWAFREPVKMRPPAVADSTRVKNPIDSFILSRLEKEGLALNRPEQPNRLLRRLTFGLTGLPPSLSDQTAFQNEAEYERAVDRLLASPGFGNRWAQHWLDVVRFAESDGFKSDVHRPNAYRYRDYVIRAFNNDLPYDQFVTQQLAGDELEPHNPQAIIATGLNRLYPDEDNAANLFQRRQEILDDITEATGLTFFGLTMGCAQCHDHKFDEILQEDYFRLQAFFAPLVPKDDYLLASPEQQAAYDAKMDAWQAATKDLRAEMDQLLFEEREKATAYSLSKFEPAIQACYRKPADERNPYEEQIARIAAKQVNKATRPGALAKKLSKEDKQTYAELEAVLKDFDHLKPEPLPSAMVVSNLSRSPPTHLLDGGSWKNPLDKVEPGFPVSFNEPEPLIKLVSSRQQANGSAGTGRRTALARWLTSGHHPLTARVIVNRLWQHHFGRGIVGTPNDFGIQGEPPTHPELLDWLAVELVENEWSLKHIHRLIVTSETYRQSSTIDSSSANALAMQIDPNNSLWWHAEQKRLEGEAIRDAMLAVSGQLDTRMFGPSSKPKLPEGISKRYAWKPDEKLADQRRRSVFVLAKRNMRFPLFDAYDLPDMFNSCGRRTQSTTTPQALMLLNSETTLELASNWASDLHSRFAHQGDQLIERVYQLAFARMPTPDQRQQALEFLQTNESPSTDAAESRLVSKRGISAEAISDFCHAIFNCNEFVYVD